VFTENRSPSVDTPGLCHGKRRGRNSVAPRPGGEIVG